MIYNFYCYGNDDVSPVDSRYEKIKNPKMLYEILSDLWCAESCAPRMRDKWTSQNKTLGQCSITAFLAQDIFGGKVYGIPLDDGNFHCYNVVDDCVFDLTSEQFGDKKLCYENNPEQFRETHFKKEEKFLRYKFLKSQLEAKIQDKILYINSCVRADSRTDKIARALLEKLSGEYDEINLSEADIKPLSEEKLEKRNALVSISDYSDEMFNYAKQFAQADIIVISAPFWDLSFPASLKVYLENIYAIGIVSCYTENGIPKGLCKAKKLYYVTTSGGKFIPDFSFDYIKTLAQQCFGIKEVELIKAENLDVIGFDAEKEVKKVIESLYILQ